MWIHLEIIVMLENGNAKMQYSYALQQLLKTQDMEKVLQINRGKKYQARMLTELLFISDAEHPVFLTCPLLDISLHCPQIYCYQPPTARLY